MKIKPIGTAMNVFLWILQALLAFWNITGALYMMGNYGDLAKAWALNILPGFFWTILGVFQILLAVGLIVPGMIESIRKYTSVSASGIAVLSLLGVVLYSAYSGLLGMLWGLIPATLAGFIAYKRYEP